MYFLKKDFISLKDITADEILYILSTAETMKYVLNQKNKKSPHLQGKSVVFLFYEKSSKTRISYELAAQYLSASTVDMTLSKNLEHGETLRDVGRIVDQMGADFIIIRHPMAGSAKFLSETSQASVINAGDGLNENPSQSLLDLLTIKDQKGGFQGLKVTIVGDVLHSRVGKSNILALLKLGATVNVAAPPTLIPFELSQFGVNIFFDAKKAVEDADVVMVLRMQSERQYESLLPSFNEYKKFFKIDNELMSYAKKNAIVMHPGPVFRGVEISSSIIDSKRCLTDDQIANGVAVRMALLYLLSMKGGARYE